MVNSVIWALHKPDRKGRTHATDLLYNPSQQHHPVAKWQKYPSKQNIFNFHTNQGRWENEWNSWIFSYLNVQRQHFNRFVSPDPDPLQLQENEFHKISMRPKEKKNKIQREMKNASLSKSTHRKHSNSKLSQMQNEIQMNLNCNPLV